MKAFKTLALGAGLSGLLLSAAYAEGLAGKVIGFSQIGSESGWRAAATDLVTLVSAARQPDSDPICQQPVTFPARPSA